MTLFVKEMDFLGINRTSKVHLGLLSFNITAKFVSGINFIVGGLHECGMGLNYAICEGRNTSCKEIRLNDKIITAKKLRQMSYYIAGEDTFSLLGHKTVMEHLKKAEKKHNIDIKEIIAKFELGGDGNPSRLHLKVSALSHSRFLYSSAIGFANGKKILCFPWLSYSELQSQTYRFSLLSKIAIEQDIILIIPVENTDLFKGEFTYNEINAINSHVLKIYDNFIRTLKQCKSHLLQLNDDSIEAHSFAKFYTEAKNFLHEELLNLLKKNKLIDDVTFNKCLCLTLKFADLENNLPHSGIEYNNRGELLRLCDEILIAMKN